MVRYRAVPGIVHFHEGDDWNLNNKRRHVERCQAKMFCSQMSPLNWVNICVRYSMIMNYVYIRHKYIHIYTSYPCTYSYVNLCIHIYIYLFTHPYEIEMIHFSFRELCPKIPWPKFLWCIHLGKQVPLGFQRPPGWHEPWKKGPGCLGYLLGMTSYPVMWGLFHKPSSRSRGLNNQDPMESKGKAVFFSPWLTWFLWRLRDPYSEPSFATPGRGYSHAKLYFHIST